MWHLKEILFGLLNSVLQSFDESSMNHLKNIFELCFFCMHKNEFLCEEFWKMCQQPDRDNITILMSHALETFPISFGLTLTFFSLIASTSPDLCKQTVEFLCNMNQFCEYFDSLNSDEYTSNGEQIRLVKQRKLFEGNMLLKGQKGTLIGGNSDPNATQTSIHQMILQYPTVCWNMNFNCLELIQNHLTKIVFLAAQNKLSPEAIPIIQLVNSLFKQIFDIDNQIEDEYETYIKFMEGLTNSCFALFTNLISTQSPESYRLVAKILELFNNIVPNVPDKLVKLLHKNHMIGHNAGFDQMNIQELFNNRFSIMNNSLSLQYIFKSNDYELITAYIKLIDSLIKENGTGIEYMSTLCCILVFVFPQIHKWKLHTLGLNIELSLVCLNLLHNTLNTSLSSNTCNNTQNETIITFDTELNKNK